MDIEKLGLFYLGKQLDPATGKLTDTPVLYDAADLVTHAVILGMTGSGKTGLGIGLIEEAAIDGVPVIAVDPKGDLSNLLLTFPNLSPGEFAPWINPDEARLVGLSPDAFAEREAKRWKDGLAEWGEGPERIARLRRGSASMPASVRTLVAAAEARSARSSGSALTAELGAWNVRRIDSGRADRLPGV